MRLKFLHDFDDKRKKGHEVEVDKIKYNPEAAGRFQVRVVGEWKQPTWFAIAWFVRIPEDKQ